MEIALVGAVILPRVERAAHDDHQFLGLGVERSVRSFEGALVGAALLTLPSVIVILQHEL